MNIPLIDLAAQQARLMPDIDKRLRAVLAHGKYIMGPEVGELERQLARFSEVAHAISCANGTDALQLALMALNARAGEAVFCPSFTFAATAEAIALVGATPFFVDVDPGTFNISVESVKRSILSARELGLRPAGIIPVDLFGLPADYDAINDIASAEQLWVIADAAQSFGATYDGRKVGGLGTITTTSFFPSKPLGCYGDGGAIFTDDEDLRETLLSLRMHGKGADKYDNIRIGLNSRLDTIQAAVLLAKLSVYADEIDARQKIALRYHQALQTSFVTPVVPDGSQSVWAQYTVKMRDQRSRTAVMAGLADRGVATAIYYERPLHQQTAYKAYPTDPAGLPACEALSKQVFSLPMQAYLTSDKQSYVIESMDDTLKSIV